MYVSTFDVALLTRVFRRPILAGRSMTLTCRLQREAHLQGERRTALADAPGNLLKVSGAVQAGQLPRRLNKGHRRQAPVLLP